MKRLLYITSFIAGTLLLASCVDEALNVTLSGGPAPSRSFLIPRTPPSSRSGAYAFVIFTHKPSRETQSRYEHVCEAYIRNLQPSQDLNLDTKSQVITYWPLRSMAPLRTPSPTSVLLVREYDYARASVLASDIFKQGSSGPLLVAWRTDPDSSRTPIDALVLDLSDFADEDLDRAFAVWRDRVTRDPSTWHNGFRLIMFRESLRNMIQKYGDSIVAVIQPKRT